jgi:hemolysin activation/secretion protein
MIRKLWIPVLLAVWIAAAAGPPVWAAAAPGLVGEHSATEGPVYAVGSIALQYADTHPVHPPLEELNRVTFALGQAGDGFVGPRNGGNNVWFTLPEIVQGPTLRIYGSGLREIDEQIVRELNARGVIGVFVAPHEDDIDAATGRDLRDPGQSELRLVIYTGRVEGLRTFASGRRVAEEARVNDTRHGGIREHSPMQPVGAGGRSQGDLIRKDQLDEYIAYLNRHPGRRVDVAVTPGREPGAVYLDYMIAEDKPWVFYSQVSNTGTDRTTDSRQRFGFSHYQLTGRDDILQLDYVTGEFDQVNAYTASYEAPFPYLERARWRIHGARSEYEASATGTSDDAFQGDVWKLGAGLTANVYQRGDLFIDVGGGFRWMNVEADDLGIRGEEPFFIPHLEASLDRVRDADRLFITLHLERNVSAIAGTSSDEEDLFRLGGRADIDEDFTLLRWSADYSVYLEPLLNPRGWHNPRTPSSSTLAHELLLSTRGQYAFGTRLIPQVENSLGGLWSVRGYPQSLYSSDNAVIFTTEYRYHWPRTLTIEPVPRQLPLIGPFRMAPQRVYGRPDWDLVLAGFFDLARGSYSDSVPGELDETFSSVGVGIELRLLRNMWLRLDYGVALQDVRDVESGDDETHFSATFRY